MCLYYVIFSEIKNYKTHQQHNLICIKFENRIVLFLKCSLYPVVSTK